MSASPLPRSAAAPGEVPATPWMGVPRRVSLVDQTVEAIQQRISTKQWVSVLPGEEIMRTQLGISRVTLRKALAQLMAQGWITAGGRGFRHRIRGAGNGSLLPAATGQSAGGSVKWLSPVSQLELVWSTRVIYDEIRQSILISGQRLDWEHQPALWRGNPAKRLECLTAAQDTAGWILFRASPRIQRWFLENGLPCVVMGPCHEGVSLPSVRIENAALGRHAAAEAQRLGHHHLALVVFDPTVASAKHTLEGLRQLKRPDGAPGRITVISDDQSVPGLRRDITAVMAGDNPPSFFLVSEAAQALPVLGILRELGLRVPEDVSLVVRDHEPFLDRCLPELSRYTFDWLRFGRIAARLLAEVAASGSGKITLRNILPKFIPGQTLGRRRPD